MRLAAERRAAISLPYAQLIHISVAGDIAHQHITARLKQAVGLGEQLLDRVRGHFVQDDVAGDEVKRAVFEIGRLGRLLR